MWNLLGFSTFFQVQPTIVAGHIPQTLSPSLILSHAVNPLFWMVERLPLYNMLVKPPTGQVWVPASSVHWSPLKTMYLRKGHHPTLESCDFFGVGSTNSLLLKSMGEAITRVSAQDYRCEDFFPEGTRYPPADSVSTSLAPAVTGTTRFGSDRPRWNSPI